tara:strand:+ start:358 stop:1191 length:834 start_codon:yes stop_codon:yes gene_type:complete
MKEILNSHPVATLKKEISKTNIKNYSKLKKAELVTLMIKHKERFTHIKKYEKSPKAEKKLKKSDVEVEKKTKAKPTMNQKELNAIMNKGGAKLTEKKKKKKRLVIKSDNLKKAVGVSAYEANKLDFFDLMKMLPGDIKHNIGKQVKGDKNIDKIKNENIDIDDLEKKMFGGDYTFKEFRKIGLKEEDHIEVYSNIKFLLELPILKPVKRLESFETKFLTKSWQTKNLNKQIENIAFDSTNDYDDAIKTYKQFIFSIKKNLPSYYNYFIQWENYSQNK